MHVVGVSSLAAGHLTLVPQIIAELKKLGREDIVVIVGGVIPAQDYEELYADGAAAIFGPGTPIATAAIKILEILMQEYSPPHGTPYNDERGCPLKRAPSFVLLQPAIRTRHAESNIKTGTVPITAAAVMHPMHIPSQPPTRNEQEYPQKRTPPPIPTDRLSGSAVSRNR